MSCPTRRQNVEPMTQITLRKVSKQFTRPPDVAAVSDVDIVIDSGEFFTLLGPSGCGKTTTLRMVAGFYFPTAGDIFFDEENMTHRPAHKRGTGMVFQSYALFPHMSVAENVAYGLKVRHINRAARAPRIEEALSQVRLDGYASRRIDELSGGQQQRVALARALVIRPRVLLLDEPLSNLDAKLREETRREIRRMQLDTAITAIYVTHDQAEAMAMSDRIAVMESGRVHQVGTPQEIYNAPRTAFVARFIGNSNVLTSEVRSGTGTTRTVSVTGDSGEAISLEINLPAELASEPQGASILLAVRPEHVRIVPAGMRGSLGAVVRTVEFTGLATNVELELAKERLGATIVNGDVPPVVGDRVGVLLDSRHACAVRP